MADLTPESNLLALLKLLADDDPQIVETARAKLIELGAQAIPYLERASKSHEDAAVRVEAGKILREVQLSSLLTEWGGLSALPDEQIDLETGVFLLARVSYPNIDAQIYQRRLDEMAEKVRSNLKPAGKLRANLGVLNDYLFKREGFRGNWDDYFDPQNSFLNRVMDRKLGIPISLSVLYMLLAHRLKLPIKGVGIPGHFMLKYEMDGGEMYLDTFNEGRFLTRAECIQFVVEAGYPYQAEFMNGVTNREILARMLRNLILIYVDRQDELLEKVFTRFLSELTPNEDFEGFTDDDDEEEEDEDEFDEPGEEGEPS